VGLAADDLDEGHAPELLSQRPGRGLVAPHERRVDHQTALHAEVERRLERLQRVVAAVRIAREIRLAHAAHQALEASAIGDRGRHREEQDVSAGHEGVGQPVFEHAELDVPGERGLADLADHAEVDDAVLAEPCGPIGKCRSDLGEHRAAAVQLDTVALPIVEANGLDMREAGKRPGEASRRVLATGKQHEGFVCHGGIDPSTLTLRHAPSGRAQGEGSLWESKSDLVLSAGRRPVSKDNGAR